MIETRQLTKRFGGRTAVDAVTLRVARGEVVGFLGPNGAGKTTTFRMLAGVFAPTSGVALVCGHDLVRTPLAARRHLGFAPERPALHDELTVADTLGFVATLRDVPAGAARRAAVDAAIARTNLQDVRARRVGALSRGYRQRVGLAAALVGEPPVLLLDEPTVGLDPQQSAETRRLVRTLGREHAVFVSSHILADVEALCDRVIVLHRGRVLADGEPHALAARLRRTTRIDVEAAAAPDALRAALAAVPGVRAVERVGGTGAVARCRVDCTPGDDLAPALAAAVANAGLALHALVPVEPTLEDAFLTLVEGAPS